MVNFYALSMPELAELVVELGHPQFRAKQVWEWAYSKGVQDFADMRNIGGSLVSALSERVSFGSMTIAAEQTSRDGTIKRLYRLHDGHLVESVLMVYNDGRRTACISTQAGCAMGCSFCATGQMGFARHLTSAEIFEQAARFAGQLQQQQERLSNVVFMGMGEPLHNYDNSLAAVHRLRGDLGIGSRHITISTVGLVPGILKFADEGLQVRLAISLHQATDEGRGALMPVNRKWPIAELLGACRQYVDKTGRRVTFEWALIAGENDKPEVAHELGKLIRGLPCHVNLIPLNPTAGFAGAATRKPAADAFVAVLESYGIPATLRVRRGIDIDAGCGQLRDRVVNE